MDEVLSVAHDAEHADYGGSEASSGGEASSGEAALRRRGKLGSVGARPGGGEAARGGVDPEARTSPRGAGRAEELRSRATAKQRK